MIEFGVRNQAAIRNVMTLLRGRFEFDYINNMEK